MNKMSKIALSAVLLGTTLFSTDASAFCIHNRSGKEIHVLFSNNTQSMIKHLRSHKGSLIFATAVDVAKNVGLEAINSSANEEEEITKSAAAATAAKGALKAGVKEHGVNTAKTAFSLAKITKLPERGDLIYIQHGGIGSVVTALDRKVNKIHWNKTIAAGKTGRDAVCWNGEALAKELNVDENSKLTFLITERNTDGSESRVLLSGPFGTHEGIVVKALD